MVALSSTHEKKPRTYCIIGRVAQATVLDESPEQSQRGLAKKYEIPRTTLQHWINRKRELQGQVDPKTVEFFESPSGQAWLHNLVLSTFIVFHQNGNSGLPDLHEFFEKAAINTFVGTSISALQTISKTLNQQIIAFGLEETERLARNMPHKLIPGALDENFIMNEMTLILMEPSTGFILAEQLEKKEMQRRGIRLLKSL